MTNLSPAAQAVLDAFEEGWTYYDDIGPANIAAALRAAADHLKKQKGWSLGVRWSADELIGIANELEAG
jgi:hypothetical protein